MQCCNTPSSTSYDFYQETSFNDERLYPPGAGPPVLRPQSSAYSGVIATTTRPKTSHSLLTGAISGLSTAYTSRPTSSFSALSNNLRDRRWQSTYSFGAASTAAAAARDGDHEEDNLDAFITDEDPYERRKKDNEKICRQIHATRRTWKQWMQRIGCYIGYIAIFSAFHLGMWALFWASVDLNNPAFSHYILLEPGKEQGGKLKSHGYPMPFDRRLRALQKQRKQYLTTVASFIIFEGQSYPYALNFRPHATDEWGTFIHYNRRDMKKIYQLLDSLNEAVELYEEEKLEDPNGDHHTWTKVCNWDNPADDENACWIDTRAFGTYCYKSQLYGFNDGKPCILIRINKQVNWVPVSYNSYAELKAAGFPLNWKDEDFTPGFVPISCEGQTDVDKELLGPMKYYYPLRPYNGLAAYYFPFNGQLHYAPPGVMVNFYNMTFSVPIRIVCKLWARNVRHIRESPIGQLSGAVEFELMVDSGMAGQTEQHIN